jgi:hypothetical protein
MSKTHRRFSKANSLSLVPDCLAFFIDDTGHERLKGQPVYGLGGCAVTGSDYDPVLVEPWKRRRAGTNGSSDTPLHASKFARYATPANMLAMARFFRSQPFFRFAVVSTNATKYPDENELMAYVSMCLKMRILEILNRTSATSVALVFESSDRADDLLIEHFGALELEENGRKIPVEHCLMQKGTASHALEVADFVMHAVGRMARARLAGRDVPRDFDAVFRHCHPSLTSFILIDEIERADATSDAVGGVGLSSSTGSIENRRHRDVSMNR